MNQGIKNLVCAKGLCLLPKLYRFPKVKANYMHDPIFHFREY